jgi:hypothetical protein
MKPILANSQAWKKVVMEEKSHRKPQVKGILSGFPVEQSSKMHLLKHVILPQQGRRPSSFFLAECSHHINLCVLGCHLSSRVEIHYDTISTLPLLKHLAQWYAFSTLCHNRSGSN